MEKKQQIIKEIKSHKWDYEFKHLCASGLGMCLSGFTKKEAINSANMLGQDNMIDRAYRIIVDEKCIRSGD